MPSLPDCVIIIIFTIEPLKLPLSFSVLFECNLSNLFLISSGTLSKLLLNIANNILFISLSPVNSIYFGYYNLPLVYPIYIFSLLRGGI